ncbi:hypothetical protein L6E12_11705, partial [Actinokineospora sp. PR83]|nr:hypothetical protein [Actinokineospora sp. PR83]
MSGADEVTRLPDSLQKFFKVTLGMEWPEGSEGGLRAMSGAWSDFAKELRAVKDEVTGAARDVDRAMDGATATRVVDYLNKDMVKALEELATQADDLAKSSKTAAADIQKAKIMLIAMAAMALATVIALLASLFGALFTGPVIAAARVGLQAILKLLLTEIMKLSIKQVATNVLVNALKMGAFGAAFMGGLDGGIQLGQMAAGGRDDFDWDSFKGSVIGGAIGGAAAGVFHGAAKGIAKAINPKVRSGLPRNVQIGLKLGGNAGYAVGQVAMVAASNPVVNIATGGHGDVWDGLLGAMGPAQGMYKKGEYSGYGDSRGKGAKLAAIFDRIRNGTPINITLPGDPGAAAPSEGGPTSEKGQPVVDGSGNPIGTVFDPPEVHTESKGDPSSTDGSSTRDNRPSTVSDGGQSQAQGGNRSTQSGNGDTTQSSTAGSSNGKSAEVTLGENAPRTTSGGHGDTSGQSNAGGRGSAGETSGQSGTGGRSGSGETSSQSGTGGRGGSGETSGQSGTGGRSGAGEGSGQFDGGARDGRGESNGQSNAGGRGGFAENAEQSGTGG